MTNYKLEQLETSLVYAGFMGGGANRNRGNNHHFFKLLHRKFLTLFGYLGDDSTKNDS